MVELRAELAHADPGGRVVRVTALQGERVLGSCLGEAADAEQAEDRAVARLLARLGLSAEGAAAAPGAVEREGEALAAPGRSVHHSGEVGRSKAVGPADRGRRASAPAAPPAPAVPAATAAPVAPELDPEPEAEPGEPPPDPDDWSQELAGLELQLQRLGWGREQEAVFLERAFGHPSRSRLTTYADLMAYLRALEGLAAGADPAAAAVPLRRPELLRLGDELLVALGWSAERGRRFLEEQLGRSSRQQLSDPELLRFNMLLEAELIQLEPAEAGPGGTIPSVAATAAAAPPG